MKTYEVDFLVDSRFQSRHTYNALSAEGAIKKASKHGGMKLSSITVESDDRAIGWCKLPEGSLARASYHCRVAF